jgi:hypothetical protein
MSFRTFAPKQERIIEPSQQRISSLEFNLEPSYYLTHGFNSILEAFGNDIVLQGLETTVTHTDTNIIVKLTAGRLIQDRTLLLIDEDFEVEYEGANLHATEGKFVVYADWHYLYVQGGNQLRFGIDFISKTSNTYGEPAHAWFTGRYRTIIDIIEFTVDGNGKLSSAYSSTNLSLYIYEKEYYKNGYDIQKSFGLDRYMRRFITDIASDIHGILPTTPNGENIIKQLYDGIIYLKTLKAGDNISLSHDDNSITVTSNVNIRVQQDEPEVKDQHSIWIRRV